MSQVIMAASHKPIGEILDDINIDRLKTSTYTDYVRHLTSQVKCCIATDGPSLILFVESLKNCPQPCFKRDTFLDVLDSLLQDDEFVISNLLCDPFKSAKAPWKELANSLISLPDLYANYKKLDRFPNLTGDKFYKFILSNYYTALERLSQDDGTLSQDIRYFLTQCVGRISISGHKDLVWSLFTHRAMNESRPGVKKLVKEILTTPIRCDSQYQFEAFIEHLYVPIFLNSDPRNEQIESILSDHIQTNDTLRYIICDKLIFRSNHNLNYGKQVRILLNIFTYLGSLSRHDRKDHRNANICDQVETLAIDDKQVPKTTMEATTEDNLSQNSENSTTCLLTVTFLEIVKIWSNNMKVLVRSYSHNKYITAALILGLRYTTEKDRCCLMKHLDEIQSILMKAFPFYLNRASIELRQLAMCSGEVIFPRLHKLDNSMDLKQHRINGREEQEGISSSSSPLPLTGRASSLDTGSSGSKTKKIDDTKTNVDKKPSIELDFGVKFSGDLSLLQSLIDTPIEQLIKEHCMVTTPTTTTPSDNENCGSRSDKFSSKNNIEDSFSHGLTTDPEPTKQDGDSEEKCGGECGADDEDDEDDDIVGEELAKVPIYLRDCIDGLMENNNARLVRLCLIKAGELISRQYADVSTTSSNIVAPLNTPRAMDVDTTTTNAKTSSLSWMSSHSNRSLRLDDLYQLCSTSSRKGNQQVRDGASARCAGCCLCLSNNAISKNIGQSIVIDGGGVGGGNSIYDGNYEKATRYNNQSTPLTSDITAAKINHSHAPTALLIMGHQNNTTFGIRHHRHDQQHEKRQVASSTSSLLKSSSRYYSSSFFKEKPNQVSGSIKDNCLELSKLLLYLDDQFNIKHFDMYRMKAMCLLCYTEPALVAKYLLDEFNSSNTSVSLKLDIMNVLVSTAQHLSSPEYAPTPSTSPPPPQSSSSSSSSSSSLLPPSSSPSSHWSLSLSQMKTIDNEQSRRLAAGLSAKYVPMFVYGLIYRLKAEINSSPTIVWRQLKHLHQQHEMNENDSYLLSRIFFSISILVKCLIHQPIMCKLSMDLLEVLEAYRNHLDPGVRKSIISCLIAIEQSTPKVYFENNLATRYSQMCNTLAHNSLID